MRRHVAAWPAPPSPPGTHGAAAAPPASLQPRRLWPGSVAARQPAIPMGTGLRPRLARAGPPRPYASLLDPAAVLGAARGPGGRPSGPGRSCAWPSAPGEEACKTANSSRSWKTQLWQSAAKTPALGAAPPPPPPAPLPLPSQPVPHGVITVTSYCGTADALRAASVSVLVSALAAGDE